MPQIHTSRADNSFIGSIGAVAFKRMVSSNRNPVSDRVRKINEALSENDNPVIVAFKLKPASGDAL